MPIVRRPTDLPVAASCDRAWARTQPSLGVNPETLVAQLALRCSALDHCATREAFRGHEAVRAPAFRHGADKNGFSLGLSKNFRQVFGDEMRYWPFPVYSSLGDGCSFPTCLVNQDPEQPTSPVHNPPPDKTVVGESHQFPAKPLRESQSRLLNSAPSWTENGGAEDKERRGTSNPAMAIENET